MCSPNIALSPCLKQDVLKSPPLAVGKGTPIYLYDNILNVSLKVNTGTNDVKNTEVTF